MKLYFATNTISAAVGIALEEAGLSYDTHKVDFATGEQASDAYAKVNIKGRVPALAFGETILTETGALLDYIAAQAPEKELVPKDPVQAARMREAMYYLASTMHVNHAHGMRGHRWADKEESWADMRGKVAETMTASTQYMETEVLQGPYVLGDHFSLADAYLFPVSTWLEKDGVDMSPFPKMTAYCEAMNARASVKSVYAQGMLA